MSAPYVRAVGWLSKTTPFPMRELPADVRERVRAWCSATGQSVIALGWPTAAGPHECDLCRGHLAAGTFGVPAGAILYVCPEMLSHYVEAHGYAPPQAFIEALMSAPSPGTDEYAAQIALFRSSRVLASPSEGLALLRELRASAWLVRHHELVLEAATALAGRLRTLGVAFDASRVLLGAVLHDVGKIRHPGEMSGPGHQHEQAGLALLRGQGVSADIAGFCVTHASWNEPERTIEDLLVALADKLWKGRREETLEARILEALLEATGGERWALFSELDAICDEIASEGAERLQRSVV